MVGAMKTKNCATLTSLVTKFETEPGVRELDEFKEVSSLARFTCATESNAKPLPAPSPSPSPSASPAVVAAKDSPDVRSKSASPASPASTDFIISENRDIYGKDIPQADGTIGTATGYQTFGACYKPVSVDSVLRGRQLPTDGRTSVPQNSVDGPAGRTIIDRGQEAAAATLAHHIHRED